MTITLLCAAVAILGIAVCLVLAEPWQRPRYDEAASKARRYVHERLDFSPPTVSDAEIEAMLASEMNREARDG